MTEKQKQSYRQALQDLAARLRGEVSGLRESAMRGVGGEASGNLSNTPLHLADLGSETCEQEITVGLLQNEEQLLAAINAALQRLDKGTFGKCEQCGQPIPEERLNAVPYATRCVACQAKAEQATR